MSRNLIESMAKLSSSPATKEKFAKFLDVPNQNSDPFLDPKELEARRKELEIRMEEVEENFKCFTRLAVNLYDSKLPASKFVEHIETMRVSFSLLNGAAKFSLHWAKCWDLNADLHNEMPYSQVAMIDRFVIWMARNYLSEHLGCDALKALEALPQLSPPASKLVDVSGLTAPSANTTT